MNVLQWFRNLVREAFLGGVTDALQEMGFDRAPGDSTWQADQLPKIVGEQTGDEPAPTLAAEPEAKPNPARVQAAVARASKAIAKKGARR